MTTHAKLIAADNVAPYREISLTDFPQRMGRGPDVDVFVEDRWVRGIDGGSEYRRGSLAEPGSHGQHPYGVHPSDE
jgi:hypothetical protein